MSVKSQRQVSKLLENVRWASWYFLILITDDFIAFAIWFGHTAYLYNLFENVRFFSHLADFEREMAYRTEMGLYFSYYKMLVFSPSFSDGLHSLIKDNSTEYGHTINIFKRFNIYPEVILSTLFRNLKKLSNHFEWQDQVCWKINRGANLESVESCEGFGNYHYFYVYCVFAIAGSVLPSMFFLGFILSDSYFGGIVSAMAFVFNHGEATRVQWTPPLRESFAYPVFAMQMTLLTYILKKRELNWRTFSALSILTTLFCIFWQLSQFLMGTQLGSICVAYSLEFISPSLLFNLWMSFALSFSISLALLFGNGMFINSLFFGSLISILALILLRRFLTRISLRPLYVVLNLLVFLAGTIGTKVFFHLFFDDARADTHLTDLLRAKFTDFATFHTRLYTCAPEFDFIDFEVVRKLTATWLLPSVALGLLLVIMHLYQNFSVKRWLWRSANGESSSKQSSELVYNIPQLFCFCLIAWLIMRLKLFATPHLCAFSALIANEKLLETLGKRFARIRFILVALLIAGMASQGVENIREQLAMRGEYSNPEQERLFEWINRKTAPNSVYAGSMAVMANLKLSTARPIVNHPHYESEEIRNRTLKVYAIYSRKSLGEVYTTLKEMRVNFYIFQPHFCIGEHPNPECRYLAMWDLEDPASRNKPSLCRRIWDSVQTKDPASILPFKVVYKSPEYVVLKV